MLKIIYSSALVILVSIVACGNADSSKSVVAIPVVADPVIQNATPVIEDNEEVALVEENEMAVVKVEKAEAIEKEVKPTVKAILEKPVKKQVENVQKSIPIQKEVNTVIQEAKPIVTTKTATALEPDPKKIVKEVKDVDQPKTEVVNKSQPGQRVAQSRPMHKFFNYLLENYVSAEGNVNYKGINSEIERLDNYLGELQRFPPKDDWARDEKLAYWINAYNAFTIKLIVDNYPTTSITNIDGGKPWDRKWIELDGKTLSLNDIENVIIRPQFKEPRIHFAVNCAAKSCPPLANVAYTKDNLEKLLETRTSAFINNPDFNDLTGKEAKVSKIFDWYGEDFGEVASYLNKYMNMKRPPITKVVYKDYDWSLNGK